MADPTWLPEVLREAGLTVRTHGPHGDCGGYLQNGHGDMPDGQWGVMFHHTGSFGETEMGIAHHPSLDLCSQCLVDRYGTWIVCGVGVAYHGGAGGGVPGLWDPNTQMIGVEVANDGGGSPGKPHRTGWSDAQYNSCVIGMGAILKKLGRDQSRVIGHKEWAGKAQGKWDPGAIDMNLFRLDVKAWMAGQGVSGGAVASPWDETIKTFKGMTMKFRDLFWWMDKNTSETKDQLAGPDFKGWDFLGKSQIDPNRNATVPEAVGKLLYRQDEQDKLIDALSKSIEELKKGGKSL